MQYTYICTVLGRFVGGQKCLEKMGRQVRTCEPSYQCRYTAKGCKPMTSIMTSTLVSHQLFQFPAVYLGSLFDTNQLINSDLRKVKKNCVADDNISMKRSYSANLQNSLMNTLTPKSLYTVKGESTLMPICPIDCIVREIRNLVSFGVCFP